MKRKRLPVRIFFALPALIILFWFGMPAQGQSTSAQDNDTTRTQLARFDGFLDSHPEISEQIRKNPSLVNNGEFLQTHPALQTYLQDHPGIREEISENPNVFMHQENRFDRRENGRDNEAFRKEVTQFDRFMDGHREIGEQVRKNPALLDNREFVETHPALETFLREHPDVHQAVAQNPNAFMSEEHRFEQTEDRREGATRPDRERFDQFLNGHREIAEQVRKNPSLVNDEKFDKSHPELQAFLQDHPDVREGVRENPDGFMHEENRFDRREDGGDRDSTHEKAASFRTFLSGHADVARDLSRDPSLARNKEFMEHHPEFQEYLKAHPEVNQELTKNPQSFVKSAQPFNTNNAGTKSPVDPKASH